MSTISSLGVGSGLDLSTLLDQLTESEQAKLEPITAKQESYTTKLSAYGSLKSALTTFQAAASKLNDASLYENVSATTSGSAFTATADSTAVGGKYNVSVTQLAQAQSQMTPGVNSSTVSIGDGTASKITLKVGSDDAVDITVDSSNNTLEGIRDAINAKNAGVTATIVNTGEADPYRLVLTSDQTGTESTVSVTVDDQAGTGSSGSSLTSVFGSMQETVAAQNASLKINGISITSQSNTVEGAIQGVTLNLAETTSGDSTQALTLAKDTDSVKSAISDFVTAYNSLTSTMQSLRKVDTDDTDNSGVLVGDSTLSRIESQVKKSLTAQTATSDSFSYLSQIGVSLQKDGTLAIDDDKLNTALSGDLTNVASLLVGSDTSDTDGVVGGLSSTLTQLLDDNGILANATSGIESTLDDLEKQEERMQDSIDATVARYKSQFTQLDVLMSTLNSTSDYLTQQFDAMNSSSSDS